MKKKPPSRGLVIVPSPKAPKSTTASSRKKTVSKPSNNASKAVVKAREFHTPVAVLRRLDIDPILVQAAPKITESLQACFGKWTKGNPREQIINYLAVSDSLEAKSFLEAWRSIPKRDLQSLSIEAVCVRASISPLALFGAIVMAARSMKAQVSALKAILAHPDVVDATVGTAKLLGPAGTADRKLLHEAIGFLPTKKGGMEINIGFGRPAEEKDEETDADETWDDAFPPLGDAVKEWSADKHKLLEAGK